MALNPPLIPGGTLPLPVNGETFVLQRKGIQLDADILGVRKYQHKGCLYLSTLRMVFVKDPNSSPGWFGLGGEAPSDMIAYDLPLSLVRNEKFNQPIFGCNNIEGVSLPLPGTPANTHFRLSFYEGGVGTFLPLFFDLLNRNRVGPAHAPTGMGSDFTSAVQSGRFMQAAYVDPNDPSTLFLTRQPAAPDANSLTREDYYRHGPTGGVSPTVPKPHSSKPQTLHC
eukprot:Tamp_21983.p1 GENE.Tamp_21983~~Tamp_21983.p1  ORF type:complete len:225 (-),score=15.57 Tamp_21983:214-888(-)